MCEQYDKRAVIHVLQGMRGNRRIPDSTFYRWLDILAITPKRYYSANDLARLRLAAFHFQNGGSRNEFLKLLKEQRQCKNST